MASDAPNAPQNELDAIDVSIRAQPLTPDLSLTHDTTHALVARTCKFLPWSLGGATDGKASLGQHHAACFLVRCKFGTDAATRNLLATENIFTIALNAVAWNRILNELLASGLWNRSFSHIPELWDAMASLSITTPSHLVISSADIIVGESFNTPGVPGRPARGRGARAAPAIAPIEAIPGPDRLALFAAAPLSLFERSETRLPLLAYGMAKRLLGASLTRAARNGIMSLASLSAELLRPNLEKRVFGGIVGATDSAAAAHLPNFLLDLKLPAALVTPSLTDGDILRETADTIRYVYGSGEDRRAVENDRIMTADRFKVCMSKFINPAADTSTARGFLERAAAQLLSTSELRLPFVEQVSLLETRLDDRVHMLNAATPEENLEALVSEERLLTAGGSLSGPRGAELDGALTLPAIAEEPLKQAIVGVHSSAFREFADELKTVDISTDDGKLEAIDLAFACGSNLVHRLLCFGEQTIARRHVALGKLNDCRSALGAHFTFALSVDPHTKHVPGRLQRSYAFTGQAGEHVTLLNAILRAKFIGVDFYNAATGIYALISAQKGSKYHAVHPLDFWCRPGCVTDFSEFMHTLMVARGWPDTVTSGFTFKTWGVFYNKHLMRCRDMRTKDEQFLWLEKAGDQFVAFLRIVEATVYSTTVQSVPTENDRGALAPDDCQPAKNLRLAQQTLDTFVENADMWGWVGVGTTAVVIDAETLPRLSSRAPALTHVTLSKAERKAKAAAEAAVRTEQRERNLQTGGTGLDPGSTKATAFWLTPKKGDKPFLLVSGKVWDIKALCAAYRVSVDSKCFEVILCSRAAKNKMGNCPSHTASGHKSATDAAHTLTGFDYDKDAARFARDMTTDERTKYTAHLKAAGHEASSWARGKGAGGGKGTGRARGRGRGDQSHFRRPTAE